MKKTCPPLYRPRCGKGCASGCPSQTPTVCSAPDVAKKVPDHCPPPACVRLPKSLSVTPKVSGFEGPAVDHRPASSTGKLVGTLDTLQCGDRCAKLDSCRSFMVDTHEGSDAPRCWHYPDVPTHLMKTQYPAVTYRKAEAFHPSIPSAKGSRIPWSDTQRDPKAPSSPHAQSAGCVAPACNTPNMYSRHPDGSIVCLDPRDITFTCSNPHMTNNHVTCSNHHGPLTQCPGGHKSVMQWQGMETGKSLSHDNLSFAGCAKGGSAVPLCDSGSSLDPNTARCCPNATTNATTNDTTTAHTTYNQAAVPHHHTTKTYVPRWPSPCQSPYSQDVRSQSPYSQDVQVAHQGRKFKRMLCEGVYGVNDQKCKQVFGRPSEQDIRDALMDTLSGSGWNTALADVPQTMQRMAATHPNVDKTRLGGFIAATLIQNLRGELEKKSQTAAANSLVGTFGLDRATWENAFKGGWLREFEAAVDGLQGSGNTVSLRDAHAVCGFRPGSGICTSMCCPECVSVCKNEKRVMSPRKSHYCGVAEGMTPARCDSLFASGMDDSQKRALCKGCANQGTSACCPQCQNYCS